MTAPRTRAFAALALCASTLGGCSTVTYGTGNVTWDWTNGDGTEVRQEASYQSIEMVDRTGVVAAFFAEEAEKWEIAERAKEHGSASGWVRDYHPEEFENFGFGFNYTTGDSEDGNEYLRLSILVILPRLWLNKRMFLDGVGDLRFSTMRGPEGQVSGAFGGAHYELGVLLVGGLRLRAGLGLGLLGVSYSGHLELAPTLWNTVQLIASLGLQRVGMFGSEDGIDDFGVQTEAGARIGFSIYF